MLVSLFSKPQSSLSMQAKRLVAMRFLIYTGFQTSYFIGVIGKKWRRLTPGVRAAISC